MSFTQLLLQCFKTWIFFPQSGPLFGGKVMDATDAAFAPKLYHIVVALSHFKVNTPQLSPSES